MPAIADVTINDGAATPVAHTFSPIGRDQKTGVFWFEQTNPGASVLQRKRIGYKQERVLGDQNKQLVGSTRVSYTLHVPTLETLGTSDNGLQPPPTLAYREMVRVEFVLAERSIKQERKDTRTLAVNLLQHAMAVASVDDLLPSY
jgi:hypothetical protein